MQLMEALIFLVRTLAGLYIAILLLRLLFQLVRADFYNPLSQGIVKLTSPLVIPLRRILPSIRRIDTATLVLAIGFQMLLIAIILLLRGVGIPVVGLLWWTVLGLVQRVLDIYTFALILVVILSWVAPQSRSPAALLAYQLTEPLLRPVRNAVPPLGGLDFSVMIVLLAIYVLGAYILPPVPV
jgi:YggT family protein